MNPRFFTFGQSFRGSRPWVRADRFFSRLRAAQSTCQHKFSTSTVLRRIAQASRNAAKNAERDNKYPSRLQIYDAGDIRTAWVNFWKGTALFQLGTTLVFIVPMLYKNENQPDPNIRLLQAVTVGVLAVLPTAALSYVTAPFVWKVYLNIPEYARHNRTSLFSFVRALPPHTKLEFVTLRTSLIPRTDNFFVQELRALPARRFGLANIEFVRTDRWREAQREKSRWRRFREIIREPKYKFYVKDGRMYTIRTPAPGVWEEVAKHIQEQSAREAEKQGKDGKAVKPVRQPLKLVNPTRPKPIKRQTARPLQ